MENGKKFDTGKLPMSLLFQDLASELEQVAGILQYGASKYAPKNWQGLENAKGRYLDALYRHLQEYAKGNPTDDESGQSHLAHACCNLLFLMWFNNNKE